MVIKNPATAFLLKAWLAGMAASGLAAPSASILLSESIGEAIKVQVNIETFGEWEPKNSNEGDPAPTPEGK